MFSFQPNFAQATEPCLREKFYEVVRSAEVARTVNSCREAYATGDKQAYARQKRRLPTFIFMAEVMPNEGPDSKGNPLPTARWRKQAHCRLNGLVMVDFDHVDDPRKRFDDFVRDHAHWLDDKSCANAILLAHVTPSGHGLRLVCQASVEAGNLYDNAQRVATAFALPLDDQCKDASRMSFAVAENDILYINEKIFSYENEEYDKKFGDIYRRGGSAAARSGGVVDAETGSHRPVPGVECDGQHAGTAAADGEPSDGALTYDGIDLQRVVDAYLAVHTQYEEGHRRDHCNRMALTLRHLVDNSPEKLRRVVRMAPYVQRWEAAEHNTAEIDKLCQDACSLRFTTGLSKQVRAVLQRAGWQDPVLAGREQRQAGQLSALTQLGRRLRPLLAAPYDAACEGLSDANVPAAVFATGTMFCTLMTRTQYEHYDGQLHRMNPQALIIGQPGTGKGVIDWLNQNVMQVLRSQDSIARKALQNYKKKRKERTTSSKEQKQEALVEPDGIIRNLLTNTSNNQFYKRMLNAREEVMGDMWWLHVYMFDSELTSANKANGGADWIGKRDLELKAFHNELAGSDYANDDSVNDFIPVHWCSVTTGTEIALGKKYTLANINDGLCTRQAIIPMDGSRYRMIGRGDAARNADRERQLRDWGYWFDGLRGTMPLRPLVDHCYSLCEMSALEAEMSQDAVLDTLRRRAVFYATWFTVPRIAARLKGPGTPVDLSQMEVTEEDLQFASIIYDAVIYWQDYFFGQMLQESWENGARNFQPRQRRSPGNDVFCKLPREFTPELAANLLGVSRKAAQMQIGRWRDAGYVERTARARYRKLADSIE